MISKLLLHKEKLILLLLASLQVLINFATNFLVVKKIGFGTELDVYYIAMAIFSFLITSIGWSISSVLTPILIENRDKNIEGKMLINILLISIPIFLIVIGSMFFWSKLLYINYIDKVSMDTIFTIQGIFIFTFLINTINILFLAIFQEKNQYIKINFLYIIGAIIGFTFIYFTIDKYGIYAASFSQLLIQLFLLVIMLILTFSIIKKNLNFDRNTLILLWNRMKYIFFASFYYRTDELIERFITSYLTPGFLSLIGFIQRVYGAIITVLNTSIAGPTITKFSNLIKEKRYKEVKQTLYEYLILLFIIDSLIFLIVLLYGENIFLYFFNDRINKTFLPILFHAILFLFAMVFGKTLGIVQRSLLMSAKKEKSVTIISSILFTINIFLKVILTYLLGIEGLLFSILLSEFLMLITQYFYIRKVVLNEYNI